MAPAQLDENSFDRFVEANPIAVIGIIAGNAGDAGSGGDAAKFAALAGDIVASHRAAASGAVAFATVSANSRDYSRCSD